MATYCECGHVLADHAGATFDDDAVEVVGEGLCLVGDCECNEFTEVPAADLDRGYD